MLEPVQTAAEGEEKCQAARHCKPQEELEKENDKAKQGEEVARLQNTHGYDDFLLEEMNMDMHMNMRGKLIPAQQAQEEQSEPQQQAQP